jgi:hypothetical protein
MTEIGAPVEYRQSHENVDEEKQSTGQTKPRVRLNALYYRSSKRVTQNTTKYKN